jgi:hypothetical protein
VVGDDWWEVKVEEWWYGLMGGVVSCYPTVQKHTGLILSRIFGNLGDQHVDSHNPPECDIPFRSYPNFFFGTRSKPSLFCYI